VLAKKIGIIDVIVSNIIDVFVQISSEISLNRFRHRLCKAIPHQP
jgi:hypothetical protein